MKRNVFFLLSVLPFPGLAQMPGVVMQVDLDNFVVYNYDVPDQSTWGRSPGRRRPRHQHRLPSETRLSSPISWP